MNEVFRAAAELQDVCASHNWRYCFIGGLAVLRWGEPRETVDVDLTLLTGFTNEAEYIYRMNRAGAVLPASRAARVEPATALRIE